MCCYEPSPVINAGKPDRYPLDSVTLDVQYRNLHHPLARRLFCVERSLHAPGLPDGVEAGAGHHCVPVPWQQVSTRWQRRSKGRRPSRCPGSEIWLSDDGDLMVDRSTDVRHGARFIREGLSMAKTVDQYFDELQETRVWRSIFRSGTGSSTLKRALAIQQNVFLHLFSTKVRTRMLSFSATWYLGTLTLGTFLILVATGILLMLYYHPSVPQAYADTKDLQFVVSSGMFLRNLHRWSAHAMVFLVFAHMFKVFYRGAYRPPREFNWVIGVILLLITLLLSYTGYLLPWDQLAYWAITVGSNIASAVPVIGDKIHFLLLGGKPSTPMRCCAFMCCIA